MADIKIIAYICTVKTNQWHEAAATLIKTAAYFVPGAKELGQRFAQVSGYALEDTPYESAFAGYKDWFIKMYRRPGYTIEVGRGENPLPIEQFPEIYRAVLPILVEAALG